MRRSASLLVVVALTRASAASPNVPLDHPVYEELDWLRALGTIPPFSGGFRPLSWGRVERLLHAAGAGGVAEEPTNWWVMPLFMLRLSGTFANDEPRPYSTSVRPREVSGSVAATCERHETTRCARRLASVTRVTSAAGYGSWLTAVLEVNAGVGLDNVDTSLRVQRAYLASDLGPFALEIGRDTFAIGPSARTAIAWGTNAPPLDHVRISTAQPWQVTPQLSVSGQYIVGKLRAPQRFPGALVTIARAQADIANELEFGLVQLLQLGGSGAPALGIADFVLEHVRRGDASATATDTSNRRFGFDVNARIPALHGLRLYYMLVFEDIRKQFLDALRYDADHLAGFELAALGRSKQYALTVEYHQTGARSHEHSPRTTGFTNAGFVVGAPLGPDATSLYAGGRLRLANATVYPWLEVARLSSDTYAFPTHGPINRTMRGEDEMRYRLGTRVRLPLEPTLWVQGDALLERVEDYAFQDGRTRTNAAVIASFIWYPRGPLGRLGLN